MLEADIESIWWLKYLVPAAVFVGLIFVLTVIKAVFLRQLSRFTERTATRWDDEIIKRLRTPLNISIIVVALAVSVQTMDDAVRAHYLVGFAIKSGVILLITWIVERFLWVGLNFSRFSQMLIPATRKFLLTLLRIVLFILAGLAILDTLGVSITPVLASLGVGSVAVALALQDTLGNFFSGLYILLDKPVQEGDFIRMDGGTEGVVLRVGWRSTRLQLPSNNIAVIPNSKLASAIVINYDEPEKIVSVVLSVSVAYAADLEEVEKLAVEVATQVQTKQGIPTSMFQPVVRFHNFNESGIDFNLVVRAKDFPEQFLVKHELVKAIHKAFKEKGIEIPFPQRDIRVWQQSNA